MKKSSIKKIITMALILTALLFTASCGKASGSSKSDTSSNSSDTQSTLSDSESEGEDSSSSNTTEKTTSTKVQSTGITTIAEAQKNIASLIPKGFHILEKEKGKPAIAIGDLNKDGVNDVAVIIQADGTSVSEDRELLIAFGSNNKKYSLFAIAKNAVLRADEGGVWGDPFESISVDRGSILLKFYGGSNDRWYAAYRFRYQNKGFYLIGATTGSFYTPTTKRENADQEDYNLLTGDYEIRKHDNNGKIVTTKGNRGKKSLVNVMNFIANSQNKQY